MVHATVHAMMHVFVHLQAFTRLNVLHLWDFVENDLAGLGVKNLDPSAFASADFKHVSTSQMQHSLLKVTIAAHSRTSPPSRSPPLHARMRPHALRPTLLCCLGKVALLLGVSFRFSCAVASIDGLRTIGLHAGGGHGATGGGGGSSFGYELLVDATGARCPLFEALGFGQVTVLKSAQALGLVCHLKNTKTKEETQVNESNWAQQFHTAKFKALSDQGATLQNIVYCAPYALHAHTACTLHAH